MSRREGFNQLEESSVSPGAVNIIIINNLALHKNIAEYVS